MGALSSDEKADENPAVSGEPVILLPEFIRDKPRLPEINAASGAASETASGFASDPLAKPLAKPPAKPLAGR